MKDSIKNLSLLNFVVSNFLVFIYFFFVIVIFNNNANVFVHINEFCGAQEFFFLFSIFLFDINLRGLLIFFFFFWNTDVNILWYSWFFFLLYINSFILNFKAWYDMIWWLPADKTYMHKTYEDSSQFGSDVLLVLICCCFNVYTCRLCLVLIHSSMCMYVWFTIRSMFLAVCVWWWWWWWYNNA